MLIGLYLDNKGNLEYIFKYILYFIALQVIFSAFWRSLFRYRGKGINEILYDIKEIGSLVDITVFNVIFLIIILYILKTKYKT